MPVPTTKSFDRLSKEPFRKERNIFGRRRKGKLTHMEHFAKVVEDIDRRDDMEKVWAWTLKDPEFAKRLYALKKEFPSGSLPELIVYHELTRRNEQFWYQVAILGGRMMMGGLIPDFLVYRGADGIALEVQGEYWHTIGEREEKDRADRIRMLGIIIDGVKITRIVQLWERDLTDSPERRRYVIDMALTGVEVFT